MSLEDQTNIGDYVAAKPKRKLSRGRKALIGFMALGAFAATSGAGTFASFTASTDNGSANDAAGDNPFQTGKFELLNTVMDAAGNPISGNGIGGVDRDANCSTVDDDTATDPATNLPGLDDNHAECDFLFDGGANSILGGITTYVKIENNSATDGSGDGDLVFYAPTICAKGSLGTADSCDEVLIYVQEIANSGNPGTGTAEAPSGMADVNECVFGRYDSDGGAPYVGADSLPGQNDDTACTYGRPLSALPQLANRVTITDNFPALKTTGNEDERYFRIFARLPDNVTACGAIVEPAYTNATNNGGFNLTTGLGCHNGYDDMSAKFEVRWMLVA
jgi:hypothetical protein